MTAWGRTDFLRAERAENVFVFGGLNSVTMGVSNELAALRWSRY